MHWDIFNQDNNSTVGRDGDVGLARYEPAVLPPMADQKPMAEQKGFKLQ